MELQPINEHSRRIKEVKSKFDALFDTVKMSQPLSEVETKRAKLFKLAADARIYSKLKDATHSDKQFAEEATAKHRDVQNAIFMNKQMKGATRKRKHFRRKNKTHRK